MTLGIPDYLIEMAIRPRPALPCIVPGSTPVISFGDVTRASVATLGINPSKAEFLDRQGNMLRGGDRRLATLESLGASHGQSLTREQGAQVVGDSNAYFSVRPYGRWFDQLNTILSAACDVSYYEGSACHLDLVQWATNPVWSKLLDSQNGDPRGSMTAEGLPFLRDILRNQKIEILLLNGRTVIEELQKWTAAELSVVERVPGPNGSDCLISVGCWSDKQLIGWSSNLQSSWGVTNVFRKDLAQRVRNHFEYLVSDRKPKMIASEQSMDSPATITSQSSSTRNAEGYIHDGVRAGSLEELATLLQDWLATSSTGTIGSLGHGRRKLITVKLPDGRAAALNADTKREAVAEYLEEVRQRGASEAWAVVANRNGKLNKIVFRPDLRPTEGWFFYLV